MFDLSKLQKRLLTCAKPYKIGLTGGIASGKSTVAAIFSSLGIPVYNADTEAKLLVNTNLQIREEIINHFGEHIFINQQLDRKKLAEIVFNDADKLKTLNAIIHPKLPEHFETWLQAHSNYPYIIKEAAILFESESHKKLDAVITVFSPLEVRINRSIQRDGISREAVLQRIANQWTDELRRENSELEINNDGTELLLSQILQVHQLLLK